MWLLLTNIAGLPRIPDTEEVSGPGYTQSFLRRPQEIKPRARIYHCSNDV